MLKVQRHIKARLTSMLPTILMPLLDVRGQLRRQGRCQDQFQAADLRLPVRLAQHEHREQPQRVCQIKLSLLHDKHVCFCVGLGVTTHSCCMRIVWHGSAGLEKP